MKKNKIAFITPFYSPANLSGSGIIIKYLAEELSQRNFECSVITSKALNTRFWYDPFFGKKIKKNFDVVNKIKVHYLGCNHWLSFLSLVLTRFSKGILPTFLYNKFLLLHSGPILKGLDLLLAKERFDTIYISPLPAYITKHALEIAQRLKPKPKLILGACFHPALKDYLNPKLNKPISKYDLIHVFTNEEKDEMKRIFQIPESKFATIPGFLRLSAMKGINDLHQEVRKFKKKYHLERKRIILFAAGKIAPKGIYYLLGVVEKLHQENPKYILLTIGNSNLPHWKKHTRRNRYKCLIDLGFVNNALKEVVFAAADLYCMPSICESFGLTYLEAWQKQKPVIGANISAVKKLITQTSGGLVVKFGNKKQLRRAIKSLADDQKKAEKLGKNGYRAVRTIYNSQNLIPKYESIFSA